MNHLTPVTKNLIIINVIVYLLTLLLAQRGIDLNSALGLHFVLATDFNVAQLVTYMFLHASFTHLLFNMFSLWMFGPLIEQTLTSKKFLTYFFICGIGAGLCQELWQTAQYFIEGLYEYQHVQVSSVATMPMADYLNYWTTIGASGACYGILLAFGMLYPNERIVLLIPPIPMKAKYFVAGYAVIELLSAYGSNDNVAHFAHLGGMLFGFFYLRVYLRRAKQGGASVWGGWAGTQQRQPSFLARLGARFKGLCRWQKSGTSAGNAHHTPHHTADQAYNLRQRAEEQRMDEILDKIKRSGYDALTEEEKRDLFRISRK